MSFPDSQFHLPHSDSPIPGSIHSESTTTPTSAGLPRPLALPLTAAGDAPIQAKRVAEANLGELQHQEEQIAHLVGGLSMLDPDKAAALEKFVSRYGTQIIEDIIARSRANSGGNSDHKKVKGKTAEPLDLAVLDSLDALATQVVMNYESKELMDFHTSIEGGQFFNGVFTAMAPLELGIVFANSVGQGGVLIAMGTLVKQAREILALKELACQGAKGIEKDALKQEIGLLKSWIGIHGTLLEKHAANTALTTALSVPKVGSAIFHLLHQAGTTAGMVCGWMVFGVATIGAALQWRRAKKDVDEHKVWVATFQNKASSADDIQKVIDRQKKSAALHPGTLQDKEARAVSLRNALKTFAAQKAKLDQGFLKLQLNKAKGLFSAATLITALTVVFKVLAIAGIASLSIALVATGYGILAAFLGLGIIGLIYFYVKKPNLFKAYLKGVQTKLSFTKLPLAIQSYRKQYALFNIAKTSASTKLIMMRLSEVNSLLTSDKNEPLKKSDLSIDLQEPLLKKIQGKKLSDQRRLLVAYKVELAAKLQRTEEKERTLNRRVETLNKSVDKYEKKVFELKRELAEAGWKDFQQHLHKKAAKGPITTDDSEVLAEYLLQDDALLEDKEMMGLLQKLDIDLPALQQAGDSPEAIKASVAQALRMFFAMDEEDTLKMIRKQHLLENHG